MFEQSPGFRKALYIVSAVVALLIGATQAYYTATGDPQPQGLTGILAVLAFIGTFVNALAVSNTPKNPPK